MRFDPVLVAFVARHEQERHTDEGTEHSDRVEKHQFESVGGSRTDGNDIEFLVVGESERGHSVQALIRRLVCVVVGMLVVAVRGVFVFIEILSDPKPDQEAARNVVHPPDLCDFEVPDDG
jgi:cytoskeletal protein RodZ